MTMNQRIIKFRAWDKLKKEWLLGYEYPNLGGFSMFGEMMMMGEYASLLSQYFPDRLENIVLMQYTGLKDKNGKEIYESDYLEYGGEINVWCVFWGSGKYILQNISTGDIIDCNETNTKSKEGTGNRYQNPREHKAMASIF